MLLFSHSVVSDSLQSHGLQHSRPPCPSPTPRVHSNSCPSSQWCHPAISYSVIRFSFCPKSLPVSGSFPLSQFFTSGGQSIGVSASASIFPMNIQDWFPSGLTGLIVLRSKGFKRFLQYFDHLMWRTDSLENPWCWEGLKAGGEGDDRGWDGWMA